MRVGLAAAALSLAIDRLCRKKVVHADDVACFVRVCGEAGRSLISCHVHDTSGRESPKCQDG